MILRVVAALGWLCALASFATVLVLVRAEGDAPVSFSEAVAYRGSLLLHRVRASSTSYQEHGRRLYETHCSNCHGIGGSGGRAPRLDETNLRADDHALAQIIRWGRRQGGMPSFDETLSVPQVLQVVAYLRAVDETPATALPGDEASGRTLFFTRGGCAGCHAIEDEDRGVLGPDLRDIGRLRGPGYLREELVNPRVNTASQYRLMTVETLSGVRESGVVLNEDTFSVQIRDRTERVRSYQKSQLASYRVESEASLMPGYGEIFSDAELDDLVAYLAAQGRRP